MIMMNAMILNDVDGYDEDGDNDGDNRDGNSDHYIFASLYAKNEATIATTYLKCAGEAPIQQGVRTVMTTMIQ